MESGEFLAGNVEEMKEEDVLNLKTFMEDEVDLTYCSDLDGMILVSKGGSDNILEFICGVDDGTKERLLKFDSLNQSGHFTAQIWEAVTKAVDEKVRSSWGRMGQAKLYFIGKLDHVWDVLIPLRWDDDHTPIPSFQKRMKEHVDQCINDVFNEETMQRSNSPRILRSWPQVASFFSVSFVSFPRLFLMYFFFAEVDVLFTARCFV